MKRQDLIFVLAGVFVVVWFGLITAPYMEHGILGLLENLDKVMEHPFQIRLAENSMKTVLLFLLIYALVLGIYYTGRRNYRRGEEHGSAKWGDVKRLNRKYQDKKGENRILTQNVQLGLNGRKHRRNMNTLVCGGSGSGKTRFYCKPNAMQGNTSFVILDPKGEILRDVGGLLEEEGYEIKMRI